MQSITFTTVAAHIGFILNGLLFEISGWFDDFIRWVLKPRMTSKEDNKKIFEPEKTIDENGRSKPYIGKSKTYLN